MSVGGCPSCGGYGMKHDPVVHGLDDESREPAPDPSPEEQAEIDRFGIFDEAAS